MYSVLLDAYVGLLYLFNSQRTCCVRYYKIIYSCEFHQNSMNFFIVKACLAHPSRSWTIV